MSESDKDRKEKLRAAVKERVDKEEHAFRLVEKMVLLDSVDKEFFLNAGTHITVSQYNDVTEERALTKLCGYPLCNNRLTQVLKQKYKISIREKKVYDITERKNFCSNRCFKASKYFQSQLSAEAIWMREKTKSLELKLLDDAEELATKLSGSGEAILMNKGRNDGGHDRIDFKHEHVDDEHEHVDHEHEHVDHEHEHVGNEHEHVDHEHEHVGNEHEHVDDDNEDMTGVIERIENIQIDLGIDSTDSDDDSDNDDDDDNVGNDKGNDTQTSGSYFHENFKSGKMKTGLLNNQGENTKDVDIDSSFQNRTANLSKIEKQCYDVTSDGNVRGLGDGNSNEKEQSRKQCVDKVHQVLLEWCSVKTKRCLRNFFQNKQIELSDGKEKAIATEKTDKRKNNAKSTVTLPSIDSRSQVAIRGKIVSEKVTKAMSPMLSKLGLIMADISSHLTCILKTFSFTNTNIVLKPAEWTLVALILLLVLVKYSPSLTGLLSSRQRNLHSLLSNTVDDDVDRLLGVFNCEDGQQHFDMEELD